MRPPASADGHNDRVTPPRPALVRRRRGRRPLLVAVLATVLAVSGCGGAEEKGTEKASSSPSASPSTALPTGNVEVPEGITLTEPGTALPFGQPATVAYEATSKRGSVLSMTVDSVQTGKISDFAAYQLDARTKASRPYYVRATLKNVGTGDLSGAAVPLLAVDTRNTLVQPSSFNNTFARCPSTPIPAGFTAGTSARLCLVYLVPGGGTLTEMSFRPLQAFEPITWQGEIKPPVVEKKKQTRKSKKKG